MRILYHDFTVLSIKIRFFTTLNTKLKYIKKYVKTVDKTYILWYNSKMVRLFDAKSRLSTAKNVIAVDIKSIGRYKNGKRNQFL
jgi:hypothetical protein